MILLAALLLGGFLMYRWKKRKERQAELEAKLEAERQAKEEAERIQRAEEEEKRAAEAALVAEAQAKAETQAEQRAKDVEDNVIPMENLTEEERQQLLEKQAILKLIDEKPAEVAMLVKTWLAEDE